MNPTVSEVQIQPIKPNNGLIAFASVVINHSFYLGSIGIHTKLDGSGYRLTYPTKPVGGQRQNVYHPISRKAAAVIEGAVLRRIEEVMNSGDDRHRSTKSA